MLTGATDPHRHLPDAEAWQRSDDWKAVHDTIPTLGRRPLDRAFLDRPLVASLATVAARCPDHPAVVDPTSVTTYGDLVRLIHRIGGAIRSAPGAGKPFGILQPDTGVYAAALFAGIIAGRPCVPLDTANPPGRNADIARVAGIGLLLAAADDVGARTVAGDAGVLAIGDGASLPDPVGAADAWLNMDEPAYILATSGSTGQPKLIVHSQRTIAHRGCQFGDTMDLSGRDRVLFGGGSPGTYAGLAHLLAQLRAGATAHLINIRQQGMRGLLKRLDDDRITVIRAGASLLRTVASLAGADRAMAHLRLVRFSGEQPTMDDVRLLHRVLDPACRIANGYGSTEAANFQWTASPREMIDPVRVAAGIPDSGVDALVVDELARPCPPGHVGELVIRNRYNALGEWQNGRCVPGRLIPDPGDPTARIYFSGDAARQDRNGIFLIVGRIDRQVKINGQRVEPVEIEGAIREAPEVLDAAVLPRTVGDAATLLAFVVLRPGSSADVVPALRSSLRNRLPAYMVPSRIVVLDAMPRLPGGKVDGVSLLRQFT